MKRFEHMNFDSQETEKYFYEKIKPYTEFRLNKSDTIWTKWKVDNFVYDLEKVEALTRYAKNETRKEQPL